MRRLRVWLLVTTIAVLLLPAQVRVGTAAGEAYIYQDSLAAGWNEWLWDTLTTDTNVTDPVYAGTKSIAIKPGR